MKIAIVEDDINMRKSLEIAMSDYEKYEIHTFKNARDALKKLDDTFQLVISDINMPGMDGIEFVKTLGGKFEVIIITGNATLTRAIESIQLGVKDFLLKPFEIETLVTAIERTATVAKKSQKALSQEPLQADNFLGSSPVLDKLLGRVAKAAVTDASMMLLGESGVGKEVFARHIHESSHRASKPFIAINMAAIPDNLIESELFGFEKGSFTDATEAKTGQFELAEGGTLFLDEIAEMPYPLQAKLLRVLQEREVRRLGASKNTKIDVRIICATNADLHTKIGEGKFREDLYYRLSTIPLVIPPLRERREEILSIAEAALERYCTQYGFDTKSFTASARNALENYNWPGNIRELISVVERSAILSDGEIIDTEDLFLEARGLGRI
ncbi:sigma-54 dependent transcriptional regulator [Sulfuricurvum sp.]|uniref:sigma-54-dependent transcriptional regulator n=1 Tax=Sulfuricurvum sp. TaxID=2025608 RepID=UPI0025F9DA7C|nr:sigma-54 dependent transcriptional regulator [Sulfuricurvum sp.]